MTVRVKLTLLYGALFLIAGLALLSISYGLAERHGGRLAASTMAEGGAEFVLDLPSATTPD